MLFSSNRAWRLFMILVLLGLGWIQSQKPVQAQAINACAISYTIVGQWQGGFQGDIVIRNNGTSSINNWTLTWNFNNQVISQLWGGSYSQTGNAVSVSNQAWNGTIASNASVQLGFIASWATSNPTPSNFQLNGLACNGGTLPTATNVVPTATRTPAPTATSVVPTATRTPAPTGWNPPSNLVTPLNEVWQHVESTYGNLYGFRNYGWDQVIAGNGSINYCVRWDSDAPVSAALRDQIHAALARQFKKWMDAMLDNGQGSNGWPYTNVNVKVVGWAVRDRSTLQWSDNSVDIYVNNIAENAPQCAPPCGRFFNQDGDYSDCPGGIDHHYDMSLWLTKGMAGGAGGDWGQRVGSEYFVNALNSENIHIFLHEVGHTFGLDDFYDWNPTGINGFLMKAGSASQITEFDKWMLRDFWRHLKSRYGY
ncbi:cellulose-binding domain-containing protein [Herpetosiphon llansteffanensis]|uniref:cellulose-binding domain-containing protein n=1 Tax=Herpetosiphon llansteffanensis TaxID=2094568 RepID=UPI000D7CE739|nr:cellulose-binding domain-containing protein [Herpetosiphon llansteffanensis]